MLKRIKRIIKRNQFKLFLLCIVVGLVYFFFLRDPNLKQVAAPEFKPDRSKLYQAGQVEISTETKGATIHYQFINLYEREKAKKELTRLSNKYKSPISLEMGAKVKIKAFAVKEGMEDSKVVTQKYEIKPKLEKPVIRIKDLANNKKMIQITDEFGATTYYSLDGKKPSKEDKKYKKSFEVNQETVLKAISTKEGHFNSEVVSKEITFKQKQQPEKQREELIKQKKIGTGEGLQLIKDQNKKVILASKTDRNYNEHTVLIQLDNDLEINWKKEIKGLVPAAIVNLADKYIVLSESMDLIGVDKSGEILFKNKIATEDTKAVDLVKASKNELVIGGINGGNTSDPNFSIVKVNLVGEVIWDKISYYRPIQPTLESLYDIEVDSNGNVIAVGDCTQDIWADIFLSKVDSDGKIKLEERIGGEADESGYNILSGKDSYIIAAETNDSFGNEYENYNTMVAKLDKKTGKEKITKVIGGKEKYYPVSLAKQDNIFVAGNRLGQKTDTFVSRVSSDLSTQVTKFFADQFAADLVISEEKIYLLTTIKGDNNTVNLIEISKKLF